MTFVCASEHYSLAVRLPPSATFSSEGGLLLDQLCSRLARTGWLALVLICSRLVFLFATFFRGVLIHLRDLERFYY